MLAEESSDWLLGFFTFLYDTAPLEREEEENKANEEEAVEQEKEGERK